MRALTIDSEEVLISPTWSISDKINSRTNMRFTVVDMKNLTEINIGDEISFTDGVITYFKGTVENVEEYEVTPGEIEYMVTGVDFNQLADKRTIAASYVDENAGTVVTDFITQKLTHEGVTAGTIQVGVVVKRAKFYYETISAALNKIKDITSFVWNIDFDKRLNFFDRATNTAPITLDDTVQHSNFRRSRSRNQYRNTQYIRGGKGKTATQTLRRPTPEPDGVSRSFVVRFPLAEKPRIFIDSVEVIASDIGVNGLDQNKKFYFSFGSNIITQDEDEVVLTSANVLEVTYVGLRNIMAVADSPNQITDRKDKETGTSGIYESMRKETGIDDNSAAIEFAQGLLVKYGNIPSVVSFRTEVTGLQAGQLLPINKSLYGINDSFLIESINVSLSPNNTVQYAVKCLDGSALGGWEQFFKDIIGANRDFVIEGDEVLVLLNVQTERTGYEGETTTTVIDALAPSDTLVPSDTLTPGTISSEVVKND